MHRSPLLIMLSIDGLRAATLAERASTLPALASLVARGAVAEAMRPVFPSVTWPCHTSLVTGLSPARHGVLGNMTFDRVTAAPVQHYGDRTEVGIRGVTLWDRVAAAGQTTAAVCWPKTRGVAAIPDNIPEFYEQELFEQYASPGLWRELRTGRLPVDRYGAWSASHGSNPMQDWLTLEAALHLLHARPPRLLLLHFLTLDGFQHDYGVDSPEARWALAHMDALVGRLLETLAALGRVESTTLLVFGDHGFVNVDTSHQLNQLLQEEGLLDLDRHGGVAARRAWAAANGGSAHVYVLDGAPRTTPDRLRERLAALPGVEVLGPKEFPAMGLPDPAANGAQGDLVVTAREGFQFLDHLTPEVTATRPRYVATHGHSPALPGLDAAFLLAGAGVRAGVALGRISMLDVAPTAARLLGVPLDGAEGRALVEATG